MAAASEVVDTNTSGSDCFTVSGPSTVGESTSLRTLPAKVTTLAPLVNTSENAASVPAMARFSAASEWKSLLTVAVYSRNPDSSEVFGRAGVVERCTWRSVRSAFV